MDMQAVILGTYKETITPLLATLAKTIAAARKKNIPIIYCVVGFRKGYPELSPANKTFSMLAGSGRNFDSPETLQIIDTVAPMPGEVIVNKKRFSAFTGSDLEVVLRSKNIQHMVLTGVSTSGVVLSTLREAADKDYKLTVLSDCCADMDEEVHRVLTTKIFPRQAEVLTSEEWMK